MYNQVNYRPLFAPSGFSLFEEWESVDLLYNKDNIGLFYSKHILNQWEYDFYMNMLSLSSYSPRQLDKIEQIELKLFNYRYILD